MTARLICPALGIAVMALLAGCRDRQEAMAADAPRLEIKAEVAPAHTVSLVAPLDGRIAGLTVKEGAAVKANDVVLTLVNPTVERDVAYTRAQLAHAEYRLRTALRPPIRNAPRIEETDRMKAMEELARNRKARLDRYEELFKTKDVTIDELELAQAEYAAAMRDLATERATLMNAAAAQPADPDLLRLDVEKARAEMALIEERKKALTVTAPINGIVSRLLVTQGESIFPRDPLMEITDSSAMEVRGAIAPELTRHVRVGTPVEVKVFTVPPRRFMTNVKSVVPGPMLVVSVPNPDGVLQPGMAAVITVR